MKFHLFIPIILSLPITSIAERSFEDVDKIVNRITFSDGNPLNKNIFQILTIISNPFSKPDSSITRNFVSNTERVLSFIFLNVDDTQLHRTLLWNCVQDLNLVRQLSQTTQYKSSKLSRKYKAIGLGLEKCVYIFINYYNCISERQYESIINSNSSISLQEVCRSVQKVKNALESELITYQVIENMEVSELIKIIKGEYTPKYDSSMLGKKLSHFDIDDDISAMTRQDDLKFVQDGTVILIKLAAYIAICFFGAFYTCVGIFSGLLTVHLIIWVMVLSRLLARGP